MKVSVCRPRDLGPAEIGKWHGFQEGDRRLQHPSLSPEFAVLADEVRPDVRVAVIEDGNQTLGFWAFSLGPFGSARPVVPGYNDRQGVVHGPGLDVDWRALLAASRLSGWRFDHLADDQAPQRGIGVRAGATHLMDLSAGWSGYSTWVQGAHRAFMSGILRKQRRMRREHDVRYCANETAATTLAALIRLKSSQCRRRGWRDVFGSPWIRDLVERLAAMKGPGLSGHVSALRLDGEPAAIMFSLRSWSVQSMWFSAFEERYAPLSPGITGFLNAAEAAATAGVAVVDLGKGHEPYKQHLANRSAVLISGSVVGTGSARVPFSAAGVPGRVAAVLFDRSPATERRLRDTVEATRRGRIGVASLAQGLRRTGPRPLGVELRSS